MCVMSGKLNYRTENIYYSFYLTRGCMPSDMEDAKALATLVGVLLLAGPLLWLVTSFDTAPPDLFLRVAMDTIVELAVPSFGLILVIYLAIKGMALLDD